MEKQQTAQESLKELEEIISEMNKAKMEQAEKDMNPAVFYDLLDAAQLWGGEP